MKSKSIKGLSALFIVPFLLTSCSKQISEQIFAFNTFCAYKMYANNEANASIKEIIKKYDDFCSPNGSQNTSYIAKLNKDRSVNCNEEMISLMETVQQYQTSLEGYFNVLLKDVADLYKQSIDNKAFFDENIYNDAFSKVSNSSIIINENTISINGDANVDLGAIAKGYALKKCQDVLKENNISDYILDFGTSSVLLGRKSTVDGLYRIGFRYYENYYLEIKNTSIGTSSIFEYGYIEKNQQKYSHIINGLTGSAVSNFDMVMAVSNDPIITDVFSTVGMMVDTKKLQYFETNFDVKFIAFKDDSIVYKNTTLEVKNVN